MASINDLAGGLIFIVILVLLWAIIVFRNNGEPARDAISGATFITAIVGFLLAVLGLVGDKTFSITFFILIGAVALLINRPSNG